eukprot:365261_1
MQTHIKILLILVLAYVTYADRQSDSKDNEQSSDLPCPDCHCPDCHCPTHTNVPTSNPLTSRPTTFRPTTSVPTTSVPTTFRPTTSIPTTMNPTAALVCTEPPFGNTCKYDTKTTFTIAADQSIKYCFGVNPDVDTLEFSQATERLHFMLTTEITTTEVTQDIFTLSNQDTVYEYKDYNGITDVELIVTNKGDESMFNIECTDRQQDR